MKSQKASIVILSIFSALYLVLGLLLSISSEYLIPGIIYLIAGLISGLSIVGVKKQNRILLWIGIVFGCIQILDGFAAIINTLFDGEPALPMLAHVVISILFFFPVRLMYKRARAKKAVIVA